MRRLPDRRLVSRGGIVTLAEIIAKAREADLDAALLRFGSWESEETIKAAEAEEALADSLFAEVVAIAEERDRLIETLRMVRDAERNATQAGAGLAVRCVLITRVPRLFTAAELAEEARSIVEDGPAGEAAK